MQALVAHRFNYEDLPIEAMTHSSYANELNSQREEKIPNNERLEFLGDAVLGLIVARILMDMFREASEGSLSRWRSSLVSRRTLADVANALELGSCILLGRGELRTGGVGKRSILAGALEALVGAVYLDAGIEKAYEFVERTFEPWFAVLKNGDEKEMRMLDKKTHLQERTQSLYKITPNYRVVESWGPEHQKSFRVEILLGERVVTTGNGRSKKEAEQQAAGAALEILEI